MVGLIAPHGGVGELVDRMVPTEELADFTASAAKLRIKIPVSAADLSTVYRFGDGALTPLDGPMDHATWDRILDESVIERAGRKYAWTIPLALPVSAENARRITPGETIAITRESGEDSASDGDEIVATLDVTDVYPWDKAKYVHSVWLTDRTDHPGADMVYKSNTGKDWLVGGTLRVLPPTPNPAFGQYVLPPREVRRVLAGKGWNRCVAFQTRNPLHRAHEYALVYGLETLLRQGFNAGACLNPLIGETKGDDVPADVRMHTYERLITNRVLGEGDSDPSLWNARGESLPNRVLLLGLDIRMFYGGPKEAVMHAIYRQNFGFTDIIIGRKHADAPYHDGSPIWGDFDAQKIFTQLGGELLIEPLQVGFAAYYESTGRVELMENHPDEKPVFISGKEVRRCLLAGEPVDPRIMRPTTAAILTEAMSGNTQRLDM